MHQQACTHCLESPDHFQPSPGFSPRESLDTYSGSKNCPNVCSLLKDSCVMGCWHNPESYCWLSHKLQCQASIFFYLHFPIFPAFIAIFLELLHIILSSATAATSNMLTSWLLPYWAFWATVPLLLYWDRWDDPAIFPCIWFPFLVSSRTDRLSLNRGSSMYIRTVIEPYAPQSVLLGHPSQ